SGEHGFCFSFAGAGNIVAIMIGNLKGMEILRRIESGLKVTMVIEVGKKHGPWMNHYSIFFVSVSFFVVTAATVSYFIIYSARRFRITRAQSRKQHGHACLACFDNIWVIKLVPACLDTKRQLRAEAKRAIGQLQLRTLKQGDKVDAEHGAESVQAAVSSGTSNVTSINEVDSHSETASSGYASAQGADESVLEEHAPSGNDNTHLVNNESQNSAVAVLPPLDNPTFEADETQVSEVKS
ncbi:hypothetical protein CIB84_003950, partial [Bambusicola thoracicus]